MKYSGKFYYAWTEAVRIELPSAGPGCEKSGDEMGPETGMMKTIISGLPAGNNQVDAVFIPVTDIKVDGRSVNGFEVLPPFNMQALQNGKTELLLKDGFKTGFHNIVALEPDLEADEDGNSPGTYLKNSDKTKQKLLPTAKTMPEYAFNEIQEQWEI